MKYPGCKRPFPPSVQRLSILRSTTSRLGSNGSRNNKLSILLPPSLHSVSCWFQERFGGRILFFLGDRLLFFTRRLVGKTLLLFPNCCQGVSPVPIRGFRKSSTARGPRNGSS